MKVTEGNHCKAEMRNLVGDAPFYLRIEYRKPNVYILFYNEDTKSFQSCVSLTQELDFDGLFAVTAGTSITNPDKVYLDSFALYNPEEKVAISHNQHFHDAHKRKAKHDMADFDHDKHIKDLIHNEKSFFNKEMFGEENLIDMIPMQLSMTKEKMSAVLKEMYNNINYYNQITSPLHNHKTFDQQVGLVQDIEKNMTKLSNGMDSVKTQLDDLFGKMHTEADNYFKENDPNMELDTEQKSEMYEDATAELIKSIATIRKKFSVIDRKVEELGEHTDDLHSSTDKLEDLYVKDIEQRKKWIAEHPNVKSTTS